MAHLPQDPVTNSARCKSWGRLRNLPEGSYGVSGLRKSLLTPGPWRLACVLEQEGLCLSKGLAWKVFFNPGYCDSGCSRWFSISGGLGCVFF